jgi:acetoacetate decarboxylase
MRSSDILPRADNNGPASLELVHHALAPVADLPVLEVLSGAHILTAAYDYLG